MQRLSKTAPLLPQFRNGTVGLAIAASAYALPWTPAEITTTAWYDADDASTFTLAGSVASQWRDKSGNARHLTPGTIGVASTPAIALTNLAGKNTVYFDGDSYFNLASTASGIRGAFVLAKWFDTSGEYRVILGSEGDDWVGDASGGGLFSNFTAAQTQNGGKFVNGTSTAGLLSRYTSWTQHGFLPTAGNSVTNISADRPATGLASGWTPREFYGHVAEIILMTSLPTIDQRQRIEGYLAHKWALTANLDMGHPYKTQAPTL